MINIEKLCVKDLESVEKVSDMMYEWWGKESHISLEYRIESPLKLAGNSDGYIPRR